MTKLTLSIDDKVLKELEKEVNLISHKVEKNDKILESVKSEAVKIAIKKEQIRLLKEQRKLIDKMFDRMQELRKEKDSKE